MLWLELLLPDDLALDPISQVKASKRGYCYLLVRESSVEQDHPLFESLSGPEVESRFREKKVDLLFVKPTGFLVFLCRPLAFDCKSAQMLYCVVG